MKKDKALKLLARYRRKAKFWRDTYNHAMRSQPGHPFDADAASVKPGGSWTY